MEITMKIGTDETAIRFKCVNEWCCHLLSSYCIADRLDMERWWNGASGNKSSTQRKTSLEPLGTLRIQNRLFVDLHRFFEATDERLTGRAVAEIWRMREQLKVWMGLRLRSIETSFEEILKKQNRNIVRNVGRKGRDSNYFKLFFCDVSNKLTGNEWACQFYEAINLALRVPEETFLWRTMERERVHFSTFCQTFTHLCVQRWKFSPNLIFNMVESILSRVSNEVPKVSLSQWKKISEMLSSGERGTTITTVPRVCLECFS